MVVNKFYIYELWIFLGRKRVSVVVANAARQTAFLYVCTIHGDSGCEFIQTDRVYVPMCMKPIVCLCIYV